MRMRGIILFTFVGWMIFIIALSSEPADQSKLTSGAVVKLLVDMLSTVLPIADTPREKALLAAQLHNLVRKAAHAFNYFVLGCLAYRTFWLFDGRKRWRRFVLFAALFCVAFAALDELHQLYVPGRSGELRDVLIDSISALAGIGVCWLVGKGGT